MRFGRQDVGIGNMQLLLRILKLVKPPVKPSHPQELVVRTHLAQLAMMHDDDPVAFLYSGKPVGDNH